MTPPDENTPTASPPDPAVAAKRELRARAKALRAGIDPTGAGEALAGYFTADFPEIAPGTEIAGYWPKGDELDVLPLLRDLAGRGFVTALPAVSGPGWPLLFRLWRPGHPLVPGAFRIMEPMQEAPVVRPRVLLVPLLAFDRHGRRLGYGAGFYDRTLSTLRADHAADGPPVLAVGIAYAAQEVAEVPTDPYDQPLDAVLTERGVLRF